MPANDARMPLALIRQAHPGRPAFDTGVSHAIFERVAAGELPATFRLRAAEPVLAFGKQDTNSPGFARAVEAARAHGFTPVVRLAGGRAAVFHEGTIAFAHAIHAERPTRGTRERFERAATLVASALARLGVAARVGEVPGEYCPGAYSVNARGRLKLAGIGQRLTARAAHVGGVIVVTGGGRVRDVLVPVYEALDLEWDPETAGAVDDEVPGVTLQEVEHAMLAELGSRYELRESELDPITLRRADELAAGHGV